MYKSKRVAVIVPAYNEEKLISKTLTTMPSLVDGIFVVNDASRDGTLEEIKKVRKKDKRIVLINNRVNRGIGYGLREGLQTASKNNYGYMAIMAGDAQMDPVYLRKMLDDMTDRNLDFIKANRFMHFEQLQSMPKFRRVGNIGVTLMTKFATGYYSIFDSQNGYAIYTKKVVDELPWHIVGERYEYEITILIGLSIIGAKIGDFPVPALYGDEVSTIDVLPSAIRVLRVLFKGFWRRIYYKYVIYNFHPVAIFLFGGAFLAFSGFIYGLYIAVDRIINQVTPTSGTVILDGLLLLIGFQLLLTALMLDVMEEKRS